MSKRQSYNLIYALGIFALLVLSMMTTGCAPKDRDEKKIAIVENQASPEAKKELSEAMKQIQSFFELYSESDGISRPGLMRMLESNRAKVMKFLSGTTLTFQEVVELIFQFDKNGNGKITPEEVADGIAGRLPILVWIKDGADVSETELKEKIKLTFSDASQGAINGLSSVLMLFDRRWNGGNENSRVSRRELATAGLVIALLMQTDVSEALKPPKDAPKNPNDEQILVIEGLKQKLHQQIFTRHASPMFPRLSAVDQKLEWITLSLKVTHCDRLTTLHGVDGLLDDRGQLRALEDYGFRQPRSWSKIRAFTESKILGGNDDGKYDTVELCSYLSDLTYSAKVWKALDGDFSSENALKNAGKDGLFYSLEATFPRAGRSIFYNDDYWKSIQGFDEAPVGGDGDNHVDIGELAMALAAVRSVDNVYFKFDVNNDGWLTVAEARPLFKQLGFEDERVIQGFFSDIGLDGHGVSVWMKIKAFLGIKKRVDRLRPFEFYVRLVKIFPRLLAQYDMKKLMGILE